MNGFLQKMEPKGTQIEVPPAHIFAPKIDAFPQGVLSRSLGSFSLPFGSILVAFGTLSAPFWSILAPLLIKTLVFLVPEFADHLQFAAGTSDERKLPLRTLSSQGPEQVCCQRQLRFMVFWPYTKTPQIRETIDPGRLQIGFWTNFHGFWEPFWH